MEGQAVLPAERARREPFSMVPRSLSRNPAISYGAKALYALIASYEVEDGCWRGKDGLAEEMGIAARNLDKFLRELVEAGWITVRRRGRGLTNLYFTHFTPHSPIEGPAPADEPRTDEIDRSRTDEIDRPDRTKSTDPDRTKMSGEIEPVKAEPAKQKKSREGKPSLHLPRTLLSPDWRPSDEALMEAKRKWRDAGLAVNAEEEIEKFIARHISLGNKMADWNVAFSMTWANNTIKFLGGPAPTAPPPASGGGFRRSTRVDNRA